MARCALLVVTVPALLFSSMGMNIIMPRPMDPSAMSMDMGENAGAAAAMAIAAPASAPATCSSCSEGMCMMTPGQACACPICAMRHRSHADTPMADHGSSSPMKFCAAAMPCSAPVQWLMMMTQLGWDVPPASHVYPASRSMLVQPIPAVSIASRPRLSVDPPPPRGSV